MLATRLALAGSLSLLLAGCASIFSAEEQQVSVTVTCRGQVHPSYCSAANDRGTWHFQTPHTQMIPRDFSSLRIVCESSVGPFGVRHLPLFNPVSAGNYAVGGLFGAAVDATRGSLWGYPSHIAIESALCKKP